MTTMMHPRLECAAVIWSQKEKAHKVSKCTESSSQDVTRIARFSMRKD